MLQNSAEFRNLGMSKSKVWTWGAVFVGCFFLSSLLVGAQSSITQQDEENVWSLHCSLRTGLQLDNNHFDDGTTIPESYGSIPTLLKLSLRNCNLQGSIPDLSGIPNLGYLDLSSNHLSGPIPTNKLSKNITTINLSNNELNGTIPASFSGLPLLQKLILANNSLNGSIPSSIWQNRTQNASESLTVDLENNSLDSISGSSDLPQNVTLWLKGNPICLNVTNSNLVLFCGTKSENETIISTATNSTANCLPESCPYEYSPTSPSTCYCAEPLPIGYRLKSPGFSDFRPYIKAFEVYLTISLNLNVYQLYIYSFAWQEGPRLGMYLKLYPVFDPTISSTFLFDKTEVSRIRRKLTGWMIPDSDIFGPYELINFTLPDAYKDDNVAEFDTPSLGMSSGALAGIILGALGGAAAVTLSAIVSVIFLRRRLRNYRAVAKRRQDEQNRNRERVLALQQWQQRQQQN
ncbi:hypothetical protein SLEP1_g30839 [Rubroshorea leprosula]|uniref:Uncharacterized protein n=1 Tax=Rubroshorea leprosula TaxID=152421 RepID=A0AAV5K8S2_9ROSI|nr:hypothetical protein SLEP1_g30839 [Rubroshorea leprosula]